MGGGHRVRLRDSVQGPPSARTVLIAAARSLLQATAARIRDEVIALGLEFERERLLLQQQLDHLEAPLQTLQRLLPAVPVLDGEVLVLSQPQLCEALEQFDLATRTMTALLPRFREATTLRLEASLGESLSGLSAKLFCVRRRRTPGAPKGGPGSPPLQSFEKRRRDAALQLLRLEKHHERCVLDLLLSFQFYVAGELLPPPDAPARCAEGCRLLLGGQAKLHQAHALLCQLLLEGDDMLVPLLEWQLEAADADLSVAKAVLNCLPRDRALLRSSRLDDGSRAVKMRCEERTTVCETAVAHGAAAGAAGPASGSPLSSEECGGSRLCAESARGVFGCGCGGSPSSETAFRPSAGAGGAADSVLGQPGELGAESGAAFYGGDPSSVPDLTALGPSSGAACRRTSPPCRCSSSCSAKKAGASVRFSPPPSPSPSAFQDGCRAREAPAGLSVYCSSPLPGATCTFGLECRR